MTHNVPSEVLLILSGQVPPLKIRQKASVCNIVYKRPPKTYAYFWPFEIDIREFRKVSNGSSSLCRHQLETDFNHKSETYPDGMVGIPIWALRQIQLCLCQQIIWSTALVVLVHPCTVTLEVGQMTWAGCELHGKKVEVTLKCSTNRRVQMGSSLEESDSGHRANTLHDISVTVQSNATIIFNCADQVRQKHGLLGLGPQMAHSQ